MQFVVPQFIDVETKIIGPISARQFVIVLVTAGLIFLAFRLFQMFVFLPTALILGTIGGVLAFGKVNGQAMHFFLLNAVGTFKRPSLKMWGRGQYVPLDDETDEVVEEVKQKAELTKSNLASMSLMVDTGGAYVSEDVRTQDQQKQQNK